MREHTGRPIPTLANPPRESSGLLTGSLVNALSAAAAATAAAAAATTDKLEITTGITAAVVAAIADALSDYHWQATRPPLSGSGDPSSRRPTAEEGPH
jgi:hypothetical protein